MTRFRKPHVTVRSTPYSHIPTEAQRLVKEDAPVEEEKLHGGLLYHGEFAIFFPADAHAPGLAYIESIPVQKIVVKIPV